MAGAVQTFRPTESIAIAASVTSAQATLPAQGDTVWVFNGGTTLAFVALGAGTSLTAAAPTSTLGPAVVAIAGGTGMMLDCPGSINSVAVILASSTGTIYVTRGHGNAHQMSGFVTSPAASYASTGLSDQEKADCRRFAGYPVYGGLGSAGFQGWRFFQEYGLLEFRMNNLAPTELQNVRYYLAQLYPLESGVWGSAANLDTDKAAVWTHNKNEVQDRTRLYGQIRRRFCELLGVPAGPNLGDGGLRLVV